MTSKDYVALAEAVRLAREYHPTPLDREEVVDRIIHNIANVCAADNTHFDRGRFLKACGLAL